MFVGFFDIRFTFSSLIMSRSGQKSLTLLILLPLALLDELTDIWLPPPVIPFSLKAISPELSFTLVELGWELSLCFFGLVSLKRANDVAMIGLIFGVYTYCFAPKFLLIGFSEPGVNFSLATCCCYSTAFLWLMCSKDY